MSISTEIRLAIIGITGAYGLTYLVYTEVGDELHSSPQGVPKIGWRQFMRKEEAENMPEFLETSELEKAHGLRRIKRRHYTGPIELLPDLNVVATSLLVEKLSERLLNDADFVDRLREKLAA